MGGGGAAGAVQYPLYIETFHGQLLNNTGGDSVSTSIAQAMNESANPYDGESAYNPDTNIAAANSAITAFRTLVNALNNTTDYDTAMLAGEATVDKVIDAEFLNESVPTVTLAQIANATITPSEVAVEEATQAYADIQLDLLQANILPAYKAGMLNINAVTSSAFVIGEAILRAFTMRDIARYQAELTSSMNAPTIRQADELNTRLLMQTREINANLSIQQAEMNSRFLLQHEDVQFRWNVQRNEMIRLSATEMIASLLKRADLFSEMTKLQVDTERISVIAKKEERSEQLEIDDNAERWELEKFQYAGNLLAGAGGGVAPTPKKPSATASALAGGLSGAATGAAVGTAIYPGVGTIIGAAAGALLGAGAGYASAQ